MEAKKLTNNSYIIIDKYKNKLGLVFEKDSKFFYTYNNEWYDSIDDIGKSIGEQVAYTEIASFEDVKKGIEDYPIKHDDCIDPKQVLINTKEVWVYRARENSSLIFCAGWWVIPSDSVYRVSLSPKQKTISEDCLGPFKDKFTAQVELNRVNHERIRKLQESEQSN
jgi:hypothetical protein